MGQTSVRNWHLHRSSGASEPCCRIRATGGSDNGFVPRTTIRSHQSRWDSPKEATCRLEHSVGALVVVFLGKHCCVGGGDARHEEQGSVDDRARHCLGLDRVGCVVWVRRQNNRAAWRRSVPECRRRTHRECHIPFGGSDGRRALEGAGRCTRAAQDWVQIRINRRNLLHSGDAWDVLRRGNIRTGTEVDPIVA